MQLRSHGLLELGCSPGRLNSCGSNGGRNGPFRIDISVIIKGGLLAARGGEHLVFLSSR